MRFVWPVTLVLCVFGSLACEGATSDGDSHEESVTASAGEGDAQVRDLICGCALPEVGICGEYIERDGDFVVLELTGDLDLGHMPFCGQDGLRAEVDGEANEDAFVATSFRYVE